MELKLENLTVETLKSIIVSMTDFLSKEQCRTLQLLIEESRNQKPEEEHLPVPERMSQKFVDEETKRKYLAWAEKVVYSRADAIVSGQHRNQYGEVAALLALIGEIKEDMGEQGEKTRIFMEYKSKFPRHSSFQREMKDYFNRW